MYLSKVEIFGFKSFPDKVKIEFAEGVSAIVGPNGCGKSNIVDAIRWALGEQGDKILRSEKRDDIVFNGSKTRKPLSIAEVSLTFDNSKKILPTEYTEVKIARRYFRNGETEYFLNGVKVRLKDIRNLFLDTGIGPDAYSVIELKMVETILSPIKNERRKLFEEAAGIISYKQNRDLTYKRLESVRESLVRINDIIREKQRNINMLERQVKKNEEARAVFEDLKKLEIITAIAETNYLQNEINSIKENESTNISLKETLSKKIQANDIEIDKYTEKIKEIEEKLNESESNLNKKKDSLNKLEKEILVLEQKISHLENDLERLHNENINLEENIKNNQARKEALLHRINILKSTINISEKSLAEKKTKLEDAIELISNKKNELTSLGTKVKEKNKLLNEKRREYEQCKVKYDTNLDRMKTISLMIENNINRQNAYNNEKQKLESELQILETEIRKINSNLSNLQEQQSTIKNQIEKAESEYNLKYLELQKQRTKISHLENMYNNLEDYAEGVKYLVNEKKYKGLVTVIDIIDVDPKFKTAIETALGEVANYLILEYSDKVFDLIELLENNNKGKVTFILYDKLFGERINFVTFSDESLDFLNYEGVYGFADTLVQCKQKKFEKLIKYLLDEYVVVDNLNIAYKLSKDNYYKFITLDGDIVTEGVVRAGGKTNEESIRLGRDEYIKRLKTIEKELEINLKIIQDTIEEYKNKIRDLKVSETISILNEYEKRKSVLNNEISIINFKIDSLNKNIDENNLVYKKLQEENNQLKDTLNTKTEEIRIAENENSNLDKEFTFLTDEFNEIEKSYTEYQNDYNSFNLELIKLKNELKTEESTLDRITNSVELQTKQLEKNKSAIENSNQDLKEKREKIKRDRELFDELKREQEKILEEYDSIKLELDNLREIQNKLNTEQRNLRNQYDRVSQKLIDSQILIREYTIKSEQVIDYILRKYDYKISDTDKVDIDDKFIEEFINENSEYDIIRAKKRIEELNEKLKKLGGGYQQLVWDSFQEEKDELENIIKQRDDLVESEKQIRKTIERINTEARTKFLKVFEQIRENFIKIFKELFHEGDEADLKLVYDTDEEGNIIEDPLEAKIEISAKPRGKRPTSIELLSQGEKTLTAIALLFGIYLIKPSPFCVLDEVDALLDPANLIRFNKMIRKFSANTQFILITHNERTMEMVDRLYGITMQEPGVSTIVETRFKPVSQ
ncbi:MAG: chromosome segregation protein SMC [Ignavibacteria bacterium]|nr:chromosome segregation protein SMC [Ignavibacteria bacterium]